MVAGSGMATTGGRFRPSTCSKKMMLKASIFTNHLIRVPAIVNIPSHSYTLKSPVPVNPSSENKIDAFHSNVEVIKLVFISMN